jgi:hypothetical protein
MTITVYTYGIYIIYDSHMLVYMNGISQSGVQQYTFVRVRDISNLTIKDDLSNLFKLRSPKKLEE